MSSENNKIESLFRSLRCAVQKTEKSLRVPANKPTSLYFKRFSSNKSLKNLKKNISDIMTVASDLFKIMSEPEDLDLGNLLKFSKLTLEGQVPERSSSSEKNVPPSILTEIHSSQLALVMRINNAKLEKEIRCVEKKIKLVLGKIENLPKIELYKCTENGCGCFNISADAYEAYMGKGHGCHPPERSIRLVEELKKEKIFSSGVSGEDSDKVSLVKKNTKFMELYSKYGISKSRLFEEEDDGDTPVEDFCLKITKLYFGEKGMWEGAEDVLKYHFRNLKPELVFDLDSTLPKRGTYQNQVNREAYKAEYLPKILKAKRKYLKYLIRKCASFLEREVWWGIGDDGTCILDNFVVIDGFQNYDSDFGPSAMESCCSDQNNFLKNYFSFD